MPGHEGKIETQCPACHARYRVPATGAGHHARCAKCRTTFLVPPISQSQSRANRPRPPTEDDILQWLNESADDDDRVAPRPRVISDREPVEPPSSHQDAALPEKVGPLAGVRNSNSDTLLDSENATAGKGFRRTC